MFYHGTVEFRLFNATLHAGEVKANIVLAMAISAQAINQQKTLAHKTPVGDNPAFTFRTFFAALGVDRPGVQKCAGAFAEKSARRPRVAV